MPRLCARLRRVPRHPALRPSGGARLGALACRYEGHAGG
ncbi:hypothetical protein M6G08_28840 [Streptomyces sp. M92]|nr:hypothetical protein M6G08_28840 [Streptomyces sp. M92]